MIASTVNGEVGVGHARWRGSSRRPAPARACRAGCPSRRCGARSASSPRTRSPSRPDGRAARPPTRLSPCTTLNTPSGRPASLSSSARRSEVVGIALGGLQHERVAAGERHREHPHRDHRREVERRDAGAHADRLADRVGVDPGADVLAVLALHQVRDARRELDHLEPARDLALGVDQRLAVLLRDDPAQVLLVPPRAARGSASGCARGAAAAPCATPGSASTRRRDGASTSAALANGTWRIDFARGRVGDFAVARGGGVDRLAADPQGQALERGEVHGGLAESGASDRTRGGARRSARPGRPRG